MKEGMKELVSALLCVSCTGWHLAKASNDSAHRGEPASLPESMEDSGRVGEAPGHAGFVLMQLSALWNPGGLV